MVSMALAAATLLVTSRIAEADFESQLARIDDALKNDPSHVLEPARQACMDRRYFAIRLYERGQQARAERSLRYCFDLLKLPETAPAAKVSAPTEDQLRVEATREIEAASSMKPDVARGLHLYRECAACHTPEGRGVETGMVPQIAGQHRSVVIKQLADIRAGNRDAVLMVPYASPERIGGAQSIADVAAYVETLEISVDTDKGSGDDLVFGEQVYTANCARCHGATGEGNDATAVPRIQSQHYAYLVRQFEWIRDGKRRNANPEMMVQIKDFGDREVRAVLDYVSRLEPPEDLQAPAGWTNPDFAK